MEDKADGEEKKADGEESAGQEHEGKRGHETVLSLALGLVKRLTYEIQP